MTGEYFIHALSIAIFAVVFCEILITPGNVFHFYGRFIEWLEVRNENLAMPLGGCAKCFSGQIALWYFIFMFDYNIIQHIFFIVVAILATEIIVLVYGKLQM